MAEPAADQAAERDRSEIGDRSDRAGRAERLSRAERQPPRLDQPRELRRARMRRPTYNAEGFGRASEQFARFMGTAQFLVYMTAFVALWLAWNTFAPTRLQFDPRALNYTLLTLILSLQASYAAPLILLAQNRQTDRDRVGLEQDRTRDERNLADTEYLTREVAALRIALRDVATRDFVRSELRSLLEDMQERSTGGQEPERPRSKDDKGRAKGSSARPAKTTSTRPFQGIDGAGLSPSEPVAGADGRPT